MPGVGSVDHYQLVVEGGRELGGSGADAGLDEQWPRTASRTWGFRTHNSWCVGCCSRKYQSPGGYALAFCPSRHNYCD